ncbi:MAG: SET domain-containing protein-lysine N-methyltransferase [Verrucomicrobiota bacterium]
MPKAVKKPAAKKKRKKKPVFIGLDKNGNAPEFPFVTASSSSIHNRGLFAAKRIRKDDYIIQYLGERITKNESTRRGNNQHDKSLERSDEGAVYIFELTEKWDIDGNFDWNIARLANHSCEPNAEAQNVDGEIWLVALREIKKGEELTFDYGYALEHWEDHPCLCGTEKCVGYIVRKEDRNRLKKLIKKKKGEKKS